MNEQEHKEILMKLEKKYLGKKIIVDDELVKITKVYVDYRKDNQDMNRLEDEYGGIHMINEIEVLYEKNIKR